MSQRTQQQKFDMFVTAVKANRYCKNERQNLSVLRSTPIGKHIEPQIAKQAAISLVDCFHRLRLNPVESERRKLPVACLLKGGSCEGQISQYLEIV